MIHTRGEVVKELLQEGKGLNYIAGYLDGVEGYFNQTEDEDLLEHYTQEAIEDYKKGYSDGSNFDNK